MLLASLPLSGERLVLPMQSRNSLRAEICVNIRQARDKPGLGHKLDSKKSIFRLLCILTQHDSGYQTVTSC